MRPVFKFPIETFEHPLPDAEQLERIARVREAFAVLRSTIEPLLKSGSCSGRYAALCGTDLEQAYMWAIKSVVFERYNEAAREATAE